MLKIRITSPPVVRCLTAVEVIAARIHLRVRWAASIAALVICGTSTGHFPVTLTQPVPRMVLVTIKPDPRANATTATTPGAAAAPSSSADDAPLDPDAAKRSVRTVGPTFLPAR